MSNKVTAGLGLIASVGVLIAGAAFFMQDVSRADGNDFSLDLVAAAPDTYIHQGPGEGAEATAGSLQYDARNISLYVRESLEGDDYNCDDLIIFFTEVTVDPGASGTQAININYRFDAEPTGQPAVGYSDIITAGISGPGPNGEFPAQQTQETGNQNLDGNESALLIAEALDPPGSTLGVDAQSVLGTVQVNGLEAGDVAIVRVDVRFGCLAASSDPTGTLHAAIDSAETTLGDQVNVGQQDIPMLGLTQLGLTPPATSTVTSTGTPISTSPTPIGTPGSPSATPTPISTPGSPSATPTVEPTEPPTQPPPNPPGSEPGLPSTGSRAPSSGGWPLEFALALGAAGIAFLTVGAGVSRARSK